MEESNNIQMVVLVSALPEEIDSFRETLDADELEFYFADATAIETMMRSNPGFVLMKAGKVLGKWHHRRVRNMSDMVLD